MNGPAPVNGPPPLGDAGPAGDPHRFEVVARGGVRLQAYRWERPQAVPARSTVLLVHGLGEHAGRYAPLLTTLLAAGHTVVAYDQRGHGASDGRRGVLRDFDDLVDDLFAVCLLYTSDAADELT